MPNVPVEPGVPISEPISFVTTSNLHLATLLATCGCTPISKVKMQAKTPAGDPLTQWTFKSDAVADEVMALWQNPGKFRKGRALEACRDWEQMTHEERAMAVNVLAAFTSNLRHFLATIKKG